MERYRPIIEKLAAGVVLSLLFLFMASVFVPDLSEAHTDPRLDAPLRDQGPRDGVDIVAPADVERAHADLMSLGTVEGDALIIEMFAGSAGPLFTVRRRSDGAVIGLLLDHYQVEERFPEIRLPHFDFGVGPHLDSLDAMREAWH